MNWGLRHETEYQSQLCNFLVPGFFLTQDISLTGWEQLQKATGQESYGLVSIKITLASKSFLVITTYANLSSLFPISALC